MTGTTAQTCAVVDRVSCAHVVQSTGQARTAGGEEPAYLRLDRGSGVEAADLLGQTAQSVGELPGELGRVLEITGGQVLVGNGLGHLGDRKSPRLNSSH